MLWPSHACVTRTIRKCISRPASEHPNAANIKLYVVRVHAYSTAAADVTLCGCLCVVVMMIMIMRHKSRARHHILLPDGFRKASKQLHTTTTMLLGFFSLFFFIKVNMC